MSGRVKKPAVPRKKASGYKMPAPIANGEIIHDTIMKKKWRIGPSIGVGGFGEIYSACDHEASPKKGSNFPYVIKIEPHENGPLFVEKHFYVRNANKDDIAQYMKTKKLSTFGMPTYFGNGSHDYKGEKYRYLVLERYGKDLWTLFMECGRSFPVPTVFQIGLQMLEVLEYIHSKGYVHADIKGANILLGLKQGSENQTYLVDFGLATRVTDKEFKPDPKCAHNGTIEYTSRDAHLGMATMRGDLEILAYNMLQWIVGALPWETSLKNPRTVQDAKESFMKNVRTEVLKRGSVPDALIKLFEYINTMKQKDIPDYTKCRKLFEGYLKTVGKTRNSKLDFTPNKKGKATKPANDTDTNDSLEVTEKVTKKRSQKDKGDATKKVAKKRRAAKIEAKDSEEEVDKESETENDSVQEEKNKSTEKVTKKSPKENGNATKTVAKKGRAAKIVVKDSDEVDKDTDNNDDDVQDEEKSTAKSSKTKSSKEKVNSTKQVTSRGRAAKVLAKDSDEEAENCENETPNGSIESKAKVIRNKKTAKRKSLEPAVLVNVKRTKFTPKATPPAKKNHTNIATQTSGHRSRRSPRQVSFDSPICEIIGENKPSKISKGSEANSSGDIFEDTFVIEEKKVKSKKRLISDEKVTVKRVVRKVTTIKPKVKSWRDAKTIMNGASPPNS